MYWLAVHGGLQILGRHRHDLDLSPDAQRDVPFGLGATVLWPHRDLVLRNLHLVGVHLGLTIEAGSLVGRLTAAAELGATWGVREERHRFVRRGGLLLRENRLVRWRRDRDGRVTESLLCAHRARVIYPAPGDEAEAPEASSWGR